MINVQFTEQEITALRQLLHRAVLHSGMDVAEAAVIITQRLNAALRLAQESKLPVPPGNGSDQDSALPPAPMA